MTSPYKPILDGHVVIEHFVDFGSQRIHFVICPRTLVIFPSSIMKSPLDVAPISFQYIKAMPAVPVMPTTTSCGRPIAGHYIL
jgi:hypothetical protein